MLNRREALARLGGAVALPIVGLAACPVTAKAQELAQSGPAQVPLRLMNTSTREAYDLQLFVGSAWNSNALVVCDYLMRDWREKKLVTCDRRIYASLYVLQRYFSQDGRIHINSGYRTEQTNLLLREQGYNTAINSQHMQAKAVDFFIPGVDLKMLGRSVWNLGLGGTGLYMREGFVHLDTRGSRVNWGDSLL